MIAQVVNADIPINTDADIVYIVHVDNVGTPVNAVAQVCLDDDGAVISVICVYVYAVNVETGEDEGEALVPVRLLAGNLYNYSKNLDELLSRYVQNVQYRVHEQDTQEVVQDYIKSEEHYEAELLDMPESIAQVDEEEIVYKEPYTVEDIIETMQRLKWIILLAVAAVALGGVLLLIFR